MLQGRLVHPRSTLTSSGCRSLHKQNSPHKQQNGTGVAHKNRVEPTESKSLRKFWFDHRKNCFKPTQACGLIITILSFQMVNLQITYKYGCAVWPSPRSNKTERIFEADRWDGSSFWLEYIYIYNETIWIYQNLIYLNLFNKSTNIQQIPNRHPFPYFCIARAAHQSSNPPAGPVAFPAFPALPSSLAVVFGAN